MTNPSARSREKPESKKPPFEPAFNLPATEDIDDTDTPGNILTKARIIKIDGGINESMANSIIDDLIFFEAIDPGTPITMIINSGGGWVSQGWAIIDMMNMISSPVHTLAIGRIASMGATIFLAGAKGHRSITPNTSIMIHEPSINGINGQAADVSISARETEHNKERMLNFYAVTTGLPHQILDEKMGRDYYMYATEALELGIVDKIAGYPECKAVFNAAAQKSNEQHRDINKREELASKNKYSQARPA